MKYYRLIHKIVQKIKDDKIFVYSSQASFYILISAIPFITLFISIIKEFIMLTEYDISQSLLDFFPSTTQNTVSRIVNEIIGNVSGGFISFSILSLIWTSSRGISGIRRGIHFIYNVKSSGFFYDIFSSIILMITMIFLIILILVTSMVFSSIFSGIFLTILGFIIMSYIFSIVYYLFSKRLLSFWKNIPGGFFASISWIAFIKIFSFYIKNFSNHSYIYGSLTTILLLALWIYFSTIILFLGAELNIMLSNGFFKGK